MSLQRWPMHGLVLRVADLELRLPGPEQLEELGLLAQTLIDTPGQPLTDAPWARKTPVEASRDILQWHWKNWGELAPDLWKLCFVIIRDGVVVGTQEIGAKDFRIVREVDSGSWIGRQYQGQGIGKLARTAVLALAFDGLDALGAHTGAAAVNYASIGVSRSLGYTDSGFEVRVNRGERSEGTELRMTREQWLGRERPVVEIEGLEPCLPLLIGAEPANEVAS